MFSIVSCHRVAIASEGPSCLTIHYFGSDSYVNSIDVINLPSHNHCVEEIHLIAKCACLILRYIRVVMTHDFGGGSFKGVMLVYYWFFWIQWRYKGEGNML